MLHSRQPQHHRTDKRGCDFPGRSPRKDSGPPFLPRELLKIRLPRTSVKKGKKRWLDAGYRGKDNDKDSVQNALGWSVELVDLPPKPVLMRH